MSRNLKNVRILAIGVNNVYFRINGRLIIIMILINLFYLIVDNISTAVYIVII